MELCTESQVSYLYYFNAPSNRMNVCLLEMKTLFNKDVHQNHVFSSLYYRSDQSVFFQWRMEVLFQVAKIDNLLPKLSELHPCTTYRIEDLCDHDYDTRLALCRQIADAIQGIGDVKHPGMYYGLIKLKDTYYFGELVYNQRGYLKYKQVPQSYSQSLSVEDARILVNLATEGKRCKLLDPCCGVGTVVLQALDLGYDIEGIEINQGVAWKANRNLREFFEDVQVMCLDMRAYTKERDAIILDIPYNLYSKITTEEQQNLLEHCFTIAPKLVLISYEDLTPMIESVGYHIKAQATMVKQTMVRTIYILERG